MITSKAVLPTAHGRKYLGQLCKHFAHKIEVEYSDSEGTCALPTGPARLYAGDTDIRMEVDVESPEDLPRAQGIIESHILRFAFRENIDKLEWTD
ncbi:DUF2218 domain-containing protein [Rhodobacteraceae bacterium F11138]|nr:DUF2218 domain-containing protein [Rhodobacteraceae bacterium F11138]